MSSDLERRVSRGLVEKVARALAKNIHDEEHHTEDIIAIFYDDAHDAIRAVAEWLDEQHEIDRDGSVHCALSKQLEDKR